MGVIKSWRKIPFRKLVNWILLRNQWCICFGMCALACTVYSAPHSFKNQRYMVACVNRIDFFLFYCRISSTGFLIFVLLLLYIYCLRFRYTQHNIKLRPIKNHLSNQCGKKKYERFWRKKYHTSTLTTKKAVTTICLNSFSHIKR